MDEQINLGINVESKDIKSLSSEFIKVDETVQSIISHLDLLEKKIKKISSNKVSNLNSNDNDFNQSSQEYHKYQEQQLRYLEEQIKTQKEITEKQKKLSEAELNTSKAKLIQAQKAEDKNSLEAKKAKSAWIDMINESKNYRAYREKHPELFATGGQNASWKLQGARALTNVGNNISSMGVAGKIAGDIMSTAGALLKAPAAGLMTAFTKAADAALDFAKSAVQAYSEIQSIKTQLGVVFSNETQAEAMFGEISQYAVKSPFGIQQTSELAVLLKQSGVYASDLMNTLRMIGDTAGGNMEKMKRIANNYAQIVSIGKASMLDMRQFAYAGIPIFEAVSKELGVSQQELRKLISEGKVTSDIVEKVFKDLTGINGIFENATAKGAKTLKARLQNLSDAKQLAMASAGERIVNMGREYGNDSVFIKFVNTAENFFTWMQEHNNIANIEKDVKTISQSNMRIESHEKFLEQAKEMGDEDLVKIIKTELENQKAFFDVDKTRAIYAESYDIRNAKLETYSKQFGTLRQSDITQRYDDTKQKYLYLSNKIDQVLAGRDQGFQSSMTDEELEQIKAQVLVYRELLDSLKEFKKAIEESKKTTEEEIKANRERNLLNAQQNAYDEAKKVTDQKDSFTHSFETLYSIYTSSEEYKKQQEEEQQKILKEAQDLLKELDKFVDDLGSVNLPALVQQMGFGAYNEFINKTGALDPSRKLTVVEGKSDLQMSQDRKLLLNQWLAVSGKIENELGRKGQWQAINQFGRSSAATQLSDSKTNKQFFDNFSKILTNQLDILKSLAASSKTDTDKKYYTELYKSLLGSTYEFNVNTKGKDATIEAAKGVAQEFIPLWKRILASSTGLSTQGMTGTKQTIENYRDDMAIRNMTSGVLTATLKTMGIDSAMSLVRTSGSALRLKGDTGYTYQVDWKETKKAIHDFATQLSASTEVVSAYKKGLEDELNAYQELIAAGYTQSESQDLNQQKFVSSKTYERIADSGNQLVNAFGEILETAEGLQVTYNEKTKKWTDVNGNEVQVEQLKMTGKLFELIKDEMPRLRKELYEATVAEENNKLLNSLNNKVFDTRMLKEFITSQRYNDKLTFLLENPDYFKNIIKSDIETRKEEASFLSIKGKGFEDISVLADQYYTKEFQNLKQMYSDYNERLRNANVERNGGLEELDWELKMEDILDETELKEWNNIKKTFTEVTDSFVIFNTALDNAVHNSAEVLDSDEYKSLNQLLLEGQKTKMISKALLDIANYAEYGTVTPEGKNLSPENYEGWRGAKARFLKFGYGVSRNYDMEDLYIQAAKQKNLAGQNTNQFGIDSSKFYDENGNLKVEFTGKEGEQNLLDALTEADKEIIKMNQSLMDTSEIFQQLGNDITKAFTDLGKGIWEKPFEKMGENLILSKKATDGLDDVFKSLSASLLTATGQSMVKAGWDLVSRGALDANYGMIAGGLSLAAAGGVVTGIGAGMTQKNDKDDNTDKLNKLKDDLLALLRQAREDSIYYENTLRHKRAISSNDNFNVKNVHDAIITPRGEVVNTDPKDYLIATKTPKTLIGSGSPTINFNVIDKSTGIVVTQQKSTYDSETNTIDFEAIIESKVQEVIATTKGDEAFAAREMRINGRQVIA